MYQFYYYDLTFNDLQYSGLAYATITIYADGKAYAQGMVTFNIEKSVIKTDNLITQSQYQYLLLSYASRTLNEQIGSDLDTLITSLGYVKESRVQELINAALANQPGTNQPGTGQPEV